MWGPVCVPASQASPPLAMDVRASSRRPLAGCQNLDSIGISKRQEELDGIATFSDALRAGSREWPSEIIAGSFQPLPLEVTKHKCETSQLEDPDSCKVQYPASSLKGSLPPVCRFGQKPCLPCRQRWSSCQLQPWGYASASSRAKDTRGPRRAASAQSSWQTGRRDSPRPRAVLCAVLCPCPPFEVPCQQERTLQQGSQAEPRRERGWPFREANSPASRPRRGRGHGDGSGVPSILLQALGQSRVQSHGSRAMFEKGASPRGR